MTEIVTEADIEANGSDNDAQKRSRAYSRAQAALRRKYKVEFEGLMSLECEKEGIKYERRLTPREKAIEQLKAIYAEFPDLQQRR